MACAAAWYEREQPAEKKIGGGRGCWRRVEVACDSRRPKTAVARQTGGKGVAPLFRTEREAERRKKGVFQGLFCKKAKTRGFSAYKVFSLNWGSNKKMLNMKVV